MPACSAQRSQSFKNYEHFRTLGSGSLSVPAMMDFLGKANISIHGLGEDDTATEAVITDLPVTKKILAGPLSAMLVPTQHKIIYINIFYSYVQSSAQCFSALPNI